MIASLADGLTSFYGGFVIFSVVGFMAKEANMSVTEVATQGKLWQINALLLHIKMVCNVGSLGMIP